jgi:UDP-GlcNAc:undecaprenyl-phosphate/decaprenyl-phosphate GlcNAc-1-phosphate transferase
VFLDGYFSETGRPIAQYQGLETEGRRRVQLIGPAAAAFALCLLATFALRPFAVALDLIDRPGGHKTHHGEIPVVGGIAMMLGVVVGFGLLPLDAEHPASGTFLAGCAILVTVGLMDDRFNLSPWARLPVHAVAALLLIFGTDAVVTTLGYPFGSGEVLMSGWPSVLFTTLAIMLAINAFNMLDGMDGLAGAMALVALTALALIAILSGAVVPAAISLVLAAAVVGFLISNVPLRFNRDVRCFMGDSGSTCSDSRWPGCAYSCRSRGWWVRSRWPQLPAPRRR